MSLHRSSRASSDARATSPSRDDAEGSIWIVVHGEAFVPESFDSQAAAQAFASDENTLYVSGPWEVAVASHAPSRLALEVYDAALHATETFADDYIGEDLAYLLAAILRGSACERPPERPLVRLLRSCFPPTTPFGGTSLKCRANSSACL